MTVGPSRTEHHRSTRDIQRPRCQWLFCAACFLAVSLGFGQTSSSVTLAWNPDTGTGIAGYHLYYGLAPGNYTTQVSLGNVTNTTVSGLTAGRTYYFAVTAYNT